MKYEICDILQSMGCNCETPILYVRRNPGIYNLNKIQMQNLLSVDCINLKCGNTLNFPQGSVFLQCSKCKESFFKFCHTFPNVQHEHVKCKKCVNELYYFFCPNPKCAKLSCYKNFQTGSIVKCDHCGIKASYIKCIGCSNTNCVAPGTLVQGVPFNCQYCNKVVNFMNCDACFHPIHFKSFWSEMRFKCTNRFCQVALKVNQCNRCQRLILTSTDQRTCKDCQERRQVEQETLHTQLRCEQMPERKVSPDKVESSRQISPLKNDVLIARIREPNQSIVKTKLNATLNLPPPNPTTERETTSNRAQSIPKGSPKASKGGLQQTIGSAKWKCIICWSKPAEYLNNGCYHLVSCAQCTLTLPNNCPYCRTYGEYRKIFNPT